MHALNLRQQQEIRQSAQAMDSWTAAGNAEEDSLFLLGHPCCTLSSCLALPLILFQSLALRLGYLGHRRKICGP